MTGAEIPIDVQVLAALGLVVTGAIAGTMAGLLGIGGGIVIVPVLFLLQSFLGFDPVTIMHMAVGTSLATIVPTSISSMRAHHKRGAVDFNLLRVWGPMVILGAAAGGISARYIDADNLKLIFGVIALAVAANMAFSMNLKVGDKMPSNPLVSRLVPAVIGYLSSLMGIGGGTMSVPTMTAFSYPIHRAVGTASAIGLFIALPGTIGFIWSGMDVPNRPPLSFGYLNLLAAAIIFPMTVMFAPAGAKLAHSLNQKALKTAFAIFLAITAGRMLYSAITA